jgi:hypothetical protein
VSSSLSVTIGATLSVLSPLTYSYYLDGNVAEIICYNKPLSESDARKVEKYLAAKWGITLAPQVSNADAQDWINRVYANGGTVSAATAAAVNQFCNAIDYGVSGASIRDRFYRMNLFCGGTSGTAVGLNSAVVPLYRGPSLGSALGNATDTNNGPFLPENYSETGATGGLVGNGSSKFLQTGVNPSAISASTSDFHLSVYTVGTEAVGTTRTTIGCADAGGESLMTFGSSGTVECGSIAGDSSTRRPTSNSYKQGHKIVSVTTGRSLQYYLNDSALGASATPTLAMPSREIYVAALNNAGTAAQHSLAPYFRAYSIGLGLSAPQVLAYYTAMQTFQAALNRSV